MNVSAPLAAFYPKPMVDPEADSQDSLAAVTPDQIQPTAPVVAVPPAIAAPGPVASPAVVPAVAPVNPPALATPAAPTALPVPAALPEPDGSAAPAVVPANGGVGPDGNPLPANPPAPTGAGQPPPPSGSPHKTMGDLWKAQETPIQKDENGALYWTDHMGRQMVCLPGPKSVPQVVNPGPLKTAMAIQNATGTDPAQLTPDQFQLAAFRLKNPIQPKVAEALAQRGDPSLDPWDKALNMNISNSEALQKMAAWDQTHAYVPYGREQIAAQLEQRIANSEPVKTFSKIDDAYQSAMKSYEQGPNSPGAMMGATDGLLRMLNPGASVRGQTLNILHTYQPLADKFGASALWGKLIGNEEKNGGYGGFSAQDLAQMKALTQSVYQMHQAKVASSMTGFIKQAQGFGISPGFVLAAATSGGYVAPDAGADSGATAKPDAAAPTAVTPPATVKPLLQNPAVQAILSDQSLSRADKIAKIKALAP